MPKLPEKVETLIAQQIHNELFSHITYLSMSAFFERGAFKGFARWMRVQAEEEHEHAMKFYDYLAARGVTILLKGIDAPKTEFKTPEDVFKTALAQEQFVTNCIHKIYEAALETKDYATLEMLNWFLKEQVEEEESATDMLDRVALAGSDTAALLRLDHEAAKRKAD